MDSYERQIQSKCERKNVKECLISLIIITEICLNAFIVNKYCMDIILEFPSKYLEIKIPLVFLYLIFKEFFKNLEQF